MSLASLETALIQKSVSSKKSNLPQKLPYNLGIPISHWDWRKKLLELGRGGSLVVSIFVFYSDDPSLNLADY